MPAERYYRSFAPPRDRSAPPVRRHRADRMYLNAYVPSLQTGGGVVYFLKHQLGVRVPSTVMAAP